MGLPKPITRQERYLDAIARGDSSELPNPITREEIYLDYIAKNGGGSGGTTNYNQLTNQPKVNNVTLIGNKTTEDLIPIGDGLDFNADGELEATNDYSQSSNKPSINNVELSGNKTSSDLGLMPEYEVDTTPTEDSENLITSGGVWSADKNINDKLQGSKTVTGNPITITDAEAMNAESVKVELEPKQDLHGYDKPWVGGAGKNKFGLPYKGTSGTNVGITATVNSDSSVRFQGTSQGEFYWSFKIDDVTLLLDAGTYTISSKNDIPQGVTIFIQNSSTYINAFNKSRTLTFSEPTNLICYVYIPQAENNIDFTAELQLEEGDQATSYEPYSNICPISGYSEVNVTDAPLVDWEHPTVNDASLLTYVNNVLTVYGNSNQRSVTYILPIVNKGEQHITLDASLLPTTSGSQGRVAIFDGETILYDSNDLASNTHLDFTFTTNSDYVKMIMYGTRGGTVYAYSGVEYSNITFNGDLISEPIHRYTISLGGTKYGGQLDVTEGGYSDEYIRFEFDGDEGWVQTEDNQGAFSVYVHEFNDMIDAWGVDTPNVYCNQCKNDNEAAYWGYGSCFAKNGYSLYVSNSNCETLSEFITWLSNNPLIVVGKRKTPSSVSTTPKDIALLENTNNISTNGTNIQLKYQPNNVIGECKTYTDEKCAKVLPQPPTTDGTYHLECSVSSGIPTITWVSNS